MGAHARLSRLKADVCFMRQWPQLMWFTVVMNSLARPQTAKERVALVRDREEEE